MARANPDLINQTQDFLKTRRRANLQAALRMPGFVAESAQSARPTSAVWQDWFGSGGADLDPAEAIAAKKDILENLQAAQQSRQKTGAELVRSMAKGDTDFVEHVLNAVTTLEGKAIAGTASVRSSQIGATPEILDMKREEMWKNFSTTLNATGSINGEVVNKSVRDLVDAASVQGVADGNVNQNLAQAAITAMRGLNPTERLKVQAEFGRRTGMDLEEALTQAGRTEAAQQGLAMLEESYEHVASKYPELIAEQQEISRQADEQILTSSGVGSRLERVGPGAVGILKALEEAGFISGAESDPEKIGAMLDQVFTPDGENPEDDWRNMLDTIDQHAQSDPTLAQLKQQIMNGPEFQKYMEVNQFPPGSEQEAWRTLVHQARQERKQAKKEGRERMNEMRQTMADDPQGPAEPSDAAKLAGAQPGQEPEVTGDEAPATQTSPEEVKSQTIAAFQSGDAEGYKVFWPTEDDRVIVVAPDGGRAEFIGVEEIDQIAGPNPQLFEELLVIDEEPPPIEEEEAPPEEAPSKEEPDLPGRKGVNSAVAGVTGAAEQVLTRPVDETLSYVKAGAKDLGASLGLDKESRKKRAAKKLGKVNQKLATEVEEDTGDPTANPVWGRTDNTVRQKLLERQKKLRNRALME